VYELPEDGTDKPKHVGRVKHCMIVSVICAFVWLYKWTKKERKELPLESRLWSIKVQSSDKINYMTSEPCKHGVYQQHYVLSKEYIHVYSQKEEW